MKSNTSAKKPEPPVASAKAARSPRVKKAAEAPTGKAATLKEARPDLQPADWVRAGMKILAQSGVDMVLIPPLAKALGVSAGQVGSQRSGARPWSADFQKKLAALPRPTAEESSL